MVKIVALGVDSRTHSIAWDLQSAIDAIKAGSDEKQVIQFWAYSPLEGKEWVHRNGAGGNHDTNESFLYFDTNNNLITKNVTFIDLGTIRI